MSLDGIVENDAIDVLQFVCAIFFVSEIALKLFSTKLQGIYFYILLINSFFIRIY